MHQHKREAQLPARARERKGFPTIPGVGKPRKRVLTAKLNQREGVGMNRKPGNTKRCPWKPINPNNNIIEVKSRSQRNGGKECIVNELAE